MKTLFLAAFVAVLASLCQAEMVFEKTLVEVTVEPDATDLIAEFPFKIDGDGAEIKSYDAPCSCLSARIEPLMPDRSARLKWNAGEAGKVFGKFELGNFKGTVEKVIVLNLKDQKPINLVVRVTIPDIVSVTPATHRWTQGESQEKKVYQIKIGGKKPVKITKISGTNNSFEFELITKKEGWEYEVHVVPMTLASPMLGMIRINTDSEYKRFKRLQMFSVVQAKR